MFRRRPFFNPHLALLVAMIAVPPTLIVAPAPSLAADLPASTLAHQRIEVPGGEQRITLKLRDMDLAEALRLIASKGKLSFSVAKDVMGKVDFEFYNERLNRILEVIISSNGLMFRQVGNTYVISQSASAGIGGVKVFQLNYASADALSKILASSLKGAGVSKAEEQLIADVRSNTIVASGNEYFLEQVERLITRLDRAQEHRIFRLNYIKAEDAAKLLQDSVFAAALTTGVKFIPVASDNALMVVASAEDLRLAAQVLDKVDKRQRQVLVEVKLIELNGTSSSVLGAGITSGSGPVDGSFNSAGFSLNYDPTKTNLGNLSVKLSALIRDNKARLLASPSIVAMDSKESTLEIIDEIVTKVESSIGSAPIGQQPVVSNIPTIGKAGITLVITPKINPDGYISMKVSPTISFIRDQERNPNGNLIATLKNERSLKSPEVRVKDGETLIMGGLNRESITDVVVKIPFLGDIPLIGSLFRTTDKKRESTELIVMITPHVIPEGDVVPNPKGAVRP